MIVHPHNSAFPNTGEEVNDGLSIRQYAAIAAMQGLLACPTSPGNPDVLAADAVKAADALLAELSK